MYAPPGTGDAVSHTGATDECVRMNEDAAVWVSVAYHITTHHSVVLCIHLHHISCHHIRTKPTQHVRTTEHIADHHTGTEMAVCPELCIEVVLIQVYS